MRNFNDYTSAGLNPWTVLIVAAIHDLDTSLPWLTCHLMLTQNGERDNEQVTIPLSSLDPPIGWRPRYTIHVEPAKVDEVLSWFSRGIVVRQSQYIGDGSICFQPMDNSDVPHWKFGEVTDVIPPEQCSKVFRVVSLTMFYDAFIPAPCRYCIEGKRTRENNPVLTERNETHCPKCGHVTGFSFDKPYHDMMYQQYTTEPETDASRIVECPKLRKPAECWVCNGTGNGARYLSEMDRKERVQAIKMLESQGYKVWYQRRGAMWRMERETVVKDWE